MSHVTELTADNFQSWIQNHPHAVVDVWAPWCGPCKSFAPLFEKASEDFQEIAFGKINADEQPLLANQLKIRSLPTILSFKEGQIHDIKIGSLPLPQLHHLLKTLV